VPAVTEIQTGGPGAADRARRAVTEIQVGGPGAAGGYKIHPENLSRLKWSAP
jgi:hypothetical protein